MLFDLKKNTPDPICEVVFTLPHRFLPESGHSRGIQCVPEEWFLAEGPAKIEIPVAYHSSFETGMHRNGFQRNANSAIAELGNVNFLKRKFLSDDRASFLDLESI